MPVNGEPSEPAEVWQPPGSPPPAPASPPPDAVRDADVITALAYGWKQFAASFVAFIVVVLVPVVVNAVILVVGTVSVPGVGWFAAFLALATLASHVAYIGIYNAALAVTAGQPVSIGKAFTSSRWGEWIVFSLAYGLMLGVGMVFCGIGALLVVAFFGLSPFFLLDGDKKIAEAFRESWATTRSHPHLPFALAVTAVVAYLGVVFFFVPAVVTYPVALVAAAALYRRATGQPVAQ